MLVVLSKFLLSNHLTQFLNQLTCLTREFTLWRKTKIFLIFNQGALLLADTEQNIPSQQVGFGKIGFQLQSSSERWTSLLHISHVPVKARQCEVAMPRLIV